MEITCKDKNSVRIKYWCPAENDVIVDRTFKANKSNQSLTCLNNGRVISNCLRNTVIERLFSCIWKMIFIIHQSLSNQSLTCLNNGRVISKWLRNTVIERLFSCIWKMIFIIHVARDCTFTILRYMTYIIWVNHFYSENYC